MPNVHNVRMADGPVNVTFTGAVNFRASAKMVADIMDYQGGRKLPRMSDAAREIMEVGVSMASLVAEARALDIDPAAAIRAKIAEKISNPETR